MAWKMRKVFVEEEIMFASFKRGTPKRAIESNGGILWATLLVAVPLMSISAQSTYAAGPCAVACQNGCGGDHGATWSGTAAECLQACRDTCESIVCGGPNNPVTFCTLKGISVLPAPPSVPAVSEWGMALLMLSVLAGISLKFRGNHAREAQ